MILDIIQFNLTLNGLFIGSVAKCVITQQMEIEKKTYLQR